MEKKFKNHATRPLECQSVALPVELQFSEASFLYTFMFNSLCRANRSTHELAVTSSASCWRPDEPKLAVPSELSA